LGRLSGCPFETLPGKAAPVIVDENQIVDDPGHDACVVGMNTEPIETWIRPTDRSVVWIKDYPVANFEWISSVVHIFDPIAELVWVPHGALRKLSSHGPSVTNLIPARLNLDYGRG
jgi:hypothetical protein